MAAKDLQDSEGCYWAAQQRDVYSHAREFLRCHDARLGALSAEQANNELHTAFKTLTTSLGPSQGGLTSAEWRAVAQELGVEVMQESGSYVPQAQLVKETTAALQGCVRLPAALCNNKHFLKHV